MDITINYLAVLVAAIASFAVGALWYSVLFAKKWKSLMGFNDEVMKNMKMTPTKSLIFGFIATLIMVYVLAHFAVAFAVSDIASAATLGFWVWVGFQAPIMANAIFYENRPVMLYLINVSYQLAATVVAAVVLSLF